MIKSLLLTLLLIFVQMTFAQNINFYGENRIGGLYVNAFCQDANNYLWLATRNGERRFDGSQFVSYYHNGKDSTSLADNEVHSLLLDREQRLWVGTANGLQCYMPDSDNFQLVTLQEAELKGRILSILQRKDGELLCIVSNVGIFRINPQTLTAHPWLTQSKIFKANSICSLFEDSKKRLWVGTDRDGVICIDTNTKKEKRYPSAIAVRKIVEDNDQRIFIITPQSVYYWNATENVLCQLPYKGNQDLQYHSAVLTTEGDLLIGTYGNGIVCVKRGEKSITETADFGNAFLDIRQSKINTLFEDSHQNIWIGCLYQGVLVRLRHPMPFSFWASPAIPSGIPGWINMLYCDKQNHIWCTVEGNGIYQLDDNGNILQHIPIQENVFAMFEDSEGTYWLGIDGKGLYSLDIRKGTLKQVYPLQGDFSIRSITEDSSKNLYIPVLGLGVLCYNLPTQKIRLFTHEMKEAQQASENSWVNSILYDSKDRIWLGHFGNISCYDTRNKRFLDLPFPSEIQSSSFFALVEGKDHTIWMATRNGLVCYNPQDNNYSVLTSAQGLPDDFICGVVKDKQGDLWCSTMQGISHINWKTKKITNYYVSNGLQENVFLDGRYTQDKNGWIYFGGGKGITSFYPDSIRKVKLTTAPFITDMLIYNKRINQQTRSGGKPIIDEEPIHATDFHLVYSDNTFTFLVSMMDYRDAGNILYEYRLKEFGDSWNQTQPGENRIQYHHLDAGIYTLEIRACENGMYSPVKSVRIHIAPPWYFSLYAKLLYALLLIGTCYLIYIAVQRKRRERIGEMKLRFFITIAHEIRSPLTLIISPLERLLKKDNDEDTTKLLQTIRYNTNRILNLLNQLLDIRRIDKGQMNLRFSKTDLQQFIGELLDMFSEQAQLQGIDLEVEFAKDLPSVWIDRNNFDKVLVNLLTNAFKYTPKGGNILVNVSTGTDVHTIGPLRNYVEISVSDTGKGLNEKELKRIFERFYQGDANRGIAPLGFGIGLNLCQSLVHLHHGVIFAENRKDVQGSRFVIRLPLGYFHLQKEEMETKDSRDTQPVRNYWIEAQAVLALEKTGRSRTRYRILIIDDDEALRRFLKESLSTSYRIDTASNGTEGWQKAVTGLPDLIVADILMPGMDGFQLLKELKKNANTNHIPIILLTSKTDFTSRIEGLEEGADGYLNKPFKLEELDALIINLITNRIRLKGKYSGNQDPSGKVTPITLPNNDEELMTRIMKVIDSNLSNPMLNVEFVIKEVGLSHTQLHRKLKEITGLTASDLIRNTRLHQATQLLKNKNLTITQIAYAVGFTSQTHFSTLFKRLYGITPTEYKEATTDKQQDIDQQSFTNE